MLQSELMLTFTACESMDTTMNFLATELGQKDLSNVDLLEQVATCEQKISQLQKELQAAHDSSREKHEEIKAVRKASLNDMLVRRKMHEQHSRSVSQLRKSLQKAQDLAEWKVAEIVS